jgi:hypothetical protein
MLKSNRVKQRDERFRCLLSGTTLYSPDSTKLQNVLDRICQNYFFARIGKGVMTGRKDSNKLKQYEIQLKLL